MQCSFGGSAMGLRMQNQAVQSSGVRTEILNVLRDHSGERHIPFHITNGGEPKLAPAAWRPAGVILARSHINTRIIEIFQWFCELNDRTESFRQSSQWCCQQALQRVFIQPPNIQTPGEVRRWYNGQEREIDATSDQTSSRTKVSMSINSDAVCACGERSEI